jgi:DNA-binding GntR family transcriptional regulator
VAPAAAIKTDSKTVAEAVTARLRDEIQRGDLKPGQRLRQAHVAAHYGVSTTPVRESFVKLEREGLLVASAHKGVMVYRPTTQDLNELYEIRIPLESLATELAVPNLTDDDLDHLKDLVEKMANAETFQIGSKYNQQFHRTIYSAAARPRLLNLIEDLRASSGAYYGIFSTAAADRSAQTDAEHRAIYEACAARSRKAAGKAMVAHLKATVDIVSGGLEASADS